MKPVIKLVFLVGMIVMTIGATIGIFKQGWPIHQEIAGVGALTVAWAFLLAWIGLLKTHPR